MCRVCDQAAAPDLLPSLLFSAHTVRCAWHTSPRHTAAARRKGRSCRGGRTSALFPVRSGAGRGLSLALGLRGGWDHAWRHCPAPRASQLREVGRPCALLSEDVSSRLRPVILAVCISLLSLGRLNRVPVQGDLVSTGRGRRGS